MWRSGRGGGAGAGGVGGRVDTEPRVRKSRTQPRRPDAAPKTRDTLATRPRHARDTPATRPRHARDTPATRPRPPRDTAPTPPRHGPDPPPAHRHAVDFFFYPCFFSQDSRTDSVDCVGSPPRQAADFFLICASFFSQNSRTD